MREAVARAIYNALRDDAHASCDYVGEFAKGEHDEGLTCLDGDFDLHKAAAAAIQAVRDHDKKALLGRFREHG